MVELPEAYVLSKQVQETLVGKTIASAAANTNPHGFAAYTGDPALYDGLLNGRTLTGTGHDAGYTCGGNVEIFIGDYMLIISTPIKYHTPGEKLPKKHQLLLEFTDGSHMSCTVQMWGCMYFVPVKEKADGIPSPLSNAFDMAYFETLRRDAPSSLSAKAFLATEQRIPGLGNGVLQDILYNAKLHPKRKMDTLTGADFAAMYNAVKDTLKQMAELGGRDTEKDLFNKPGGYITKLSKKTLDAPCVICGSTRARESYLGGNIYFCPGCQKL
jgi:formamidopyrimidine-DNA glycosylase